MTSWKEEFGGKFWNEFTSAKATKERAIQEYNIVEEKHADIWSSLKKQAQDAVSSIGSDGGKLLSITLIQRPEGFTIKFHAGDTRQATAQITHHYGVHLTATAPDEELRTQELKIRANNKNDVEFFSEQGGSICKAAGTYTPEQIVRAMLTSLL